MGKSKDTWKSATGYIWAMIGSAVGFANILSFSAKCYYNGGGAFLVPLLVAFVILGVPLLMLEGIIGQYFQLPLVSAYGKVAGRPGRFLGWISILSVTTIASYYIVITGWSIAYAYFTAFGKVSSDTAFFFSQTFLKDSGSLLNFGGFSGSVFLFTILASLFTWFVTVRDIQSGIERICSLFMPALAVLVGAFAIFVCFLPGAARGFTYYLIPDFSQLVHPRIWLTSFGQAFFSLSLALGIVVGYSKHTDKSVDIGRAMIIVALGDLLISLVAGFAIFGCIGHMSHVSGVPFSQVITPSTFGLGFVVFPQILQLFNPWFAMLLGPLFFFSLFIAGITGVFSIVESIAGNFEEEFMLSRARAITTTIIMVFSFSAIFCGGNATHIMDAIEPMTAGFCMLISGMGEIIVFLYCAPSIINNKIWLKTGGRRTLAFYSLRKVVPVLLVIILISSISAEVQSGFGAAEMVRWTWLFIALVVAAVLSNKAKPSEPVRISS